MDVAEDKCEKYPKFVTCQLTAEYKPIVFNTSVLNLSMKFPSFCIHFKIVESVLGDSRNRIKLMGKTIRNAAPRKLSTMRTNKLTRIMIGKAMGVNQGDMGG